MADTVTYRDIQAAHARVAPFTHYTPLLTCQSIDHFATDALFPLADDAKAAGEQRRPMVRLAFKAEHLQRVGAFKYRGATNAVLSHLDALKAQHPDTSTSPFDPSRLVVVTHSSGNHAAALACAARTAGAIAAVVMPENAPRPKLHAVQGYGARITLCKPTLQAREETAAKLMAQYDQQGYTVRFVHPFDEPLVIAGQGTMALEMLDQAPSLEQRGACSAAAAAGPRPAHASNGSSSSTPSRTLHGSRGVESAGPKQDGLWKPRRPDEPVFDIVIAPVGGGGMLSGVSTAIKGGDDRIVVIGAEPDLVNDAFHSVQTQTVQQPPQPPRTICDGLLTSLSPLTLAHIGKHVDTISTAREENVLIALKHHWERQKQLVEPSAAVGLATVLQGFNQAGRVAQDALDQPDPADQRCWGVKQWVDEILARRRRAGQDDDEIRIGIVWSGGNVEVAKVLARFDEHGIL
ncbi:uncharacterized protein PFL1_02447 [Pseudozyma flocculosa PF-1]|uniref:Serine racemase n=1 Tax=Pseudozyma flocculosa PF-1 TaxID=1277687 RepID=A0A061HBC7_9BASI|nr:uncharacterized protein PFL1_02447 [Pseudozyma flocculosa PF-1]EPQ29774.1 hypothetical protein PFL1_02447 [Pseudozyma flocculosa PF-1]